MKASSHEKHSKQQWKKTNKKKAKSSDPWARSGERPGRGHGSELFFSFFHGFLQFGQNLENTKKKNKKKKKFRPMGKVWAIHTQTKKNKKQETKKTKNQKTKKPKKQKTKKTKKTKKKKKQDCTPQGEGVRCRVLGLVFLVFLVFWVFWFFGFLVFWFFGLCVDSHCRCAKQRLPGTVSGCTRSKVDTLQYSTVCYDIVHSANEQQRGMEFNFVRLRHMLLDLCTGNAAFFSVLRLCGSRQVVAHCCAE